MFRDAARSHVELSGDRGKLDQDLSEEYIDNLISFWSE